MKNNKFLSIIIFSLVFCVGLSTVVMAARYTGSFLGRESYRGYFTNIYDAYGEINSPLAYVLPARSGGDALPSDEIKDVDSFINLLKLYNKTGTDQEKVGSGFIVNTMFGRIAPDVGAGIKDQYWIIQDKDWTDLTVFLTDLQNKGRIQWNVKVDNAARNINTFYQGGGTGENPVDDAFYAYTRSENGIIIRDFDGGVYSILRRCANPVGDLTLKPSIRPWSSSTKTTIASSSDPLPGSTIEWRHNAFNDGAFETDVVLDTYYANGVGFTDQATQFDKKTHPAGAFVGKLRPEFSSFYTIPAGTAPGTKYCRSTKVSSGSNILAESFACVTVADPGGIDPVSNYCRPIEFIVRPRKYESKVVYAGEHTGYVTIGEDIVPVTAFSSLGATVKQIWSNPVSSLNGETVNATENHTTGDFYKITIKETRNHLVDVKDVYDDPNTPIEDRSVSYYELLKKNPPNTIPLYGPDVVGETTNSSDPARGAFLRYGTKPGYDYTRYIYSDDTTTKGVIAYNTKGGGELPFLAADGASPSGSGIGPCYNYALSTSVPSFTAKVESGTSIDIIPRVYSTVYSGIGNAVSHTKSMNTVWNITKIVIPSKSISQLDPIAGNNSSKTDPCSYFNPKNIGSCVSNASSGVAVFDTSGNPLDVIQMKYDTPDDDAGTRICFAFSIKSSDGWDYMKTNGNYSHASFDPANNCIIIVKKPKVQIWGGDLWTRGLVSTSQSVKNGNTFGSWGEYGILAGGAINGMASGSAFASPRTAPSVCEYSTLSFTNVPVGKTNCENNGIIGNYISNRLIPDVAANFSSAETKSFTSGSNLSGLSGVYSSTGDVSIAGGFIGKGDWVVINAARSNVTITGDINYEEGPFSDISQIPQVIIIANNINILNDVTHIDAWLVASGDLNTCSSVDKTARLTINDCDKPLIVNGPIIANRLYLRRTAGSGIGVDSNNPAEIFNTRPDAYLWAFSQASTSGRAQTVYTTELPPRF